MSNVTKAYMRLGWLIVHILIEAGVAASALIGLWTEASALLHHEAAYSHPILLAALLLAVLYISVAPSPHRSRS